MNSRLLTPQEVGERLGVSKGTVLKMIRRGKLKGQHLSPQTIRVAEAELDRYINNGQGAGQHTADITANKGKADAATEELRMLKAETELALYKKGLPDWEEYDDKLEEADRAIDACTKMRESYGEEQAKTKRLEDEIKKGLAEIARLRAESNYRVKELSDTRLRLFWRGVWVFIEKTQGEVHFTRDANMRGRRLILFPGNRNRELGFSDNRIEKDAEIE